MKYAEGYTSDDIKYCPFCACDDYTHLVQRGEYVCNGCGKQFCVIESEGE